MAQPCGFNAERERFRGAHRRRVAILSNIATNAIATTCLVKVSTEHVPCRFYILSKDTYPKSPGWRATACDTYGISSHVIGRTPLEALEEALHGYSNDALMAARVGDPVEFQAMALSPKFIAGCALASKSTRFAD